MRKAIVVSALGLISMSVLLAIVKISIDKWATSSLLRDVLRVMTVVYWTYITYNIVTLKYKWTKKLAGING